MLGIGSNDSGGALAANAVAARDKFGETKRALNLCAYACFFLFLAVLLAVVIRALAGYPRGAAFEAIITGLAVPAAAFAGGVLLGLLFGIPTTGTGESAGAPAPEQKAGEGDAEAEGEAAQEAPPASRTSRIGHNDSLVRVSSWLATVIVGVSLVQLDDMLDRLDLAGRAVSEALLGCAAGCATASMGLIVPGTALIITFLLGGFLCGYLWTRVFFYDELRILDGGVTPESRATAARAAREGNVQASPTSVLSGARIAHAAAPAASVDLFETLRAGKAAAEEEEAGLGAEDDGAADSNDPWRGRFGGESENGGYRLSAEVGRSNVPEYFSVRLRVSRVGSEGGEAREVDFYLHPTFPKPRVKRRLNKRGRADLALLAWGAFTVGARLDNGVELELNLAELSSAPETFRLR